MLRIIMLNLNGVCSAWEKSESRWFVKFATAYTTYGLNNLAKT